MHTRINLLKLLKDIIKSACQGAEVFIACEHKDKNIKTPYVIINFAGEVIEKTDIAPRRNIHNAKLDFKVVTQGDDLKSINNVFSYVDKIEKILAEQQLNIEDINLLSCSELTNYYEENTPFVSITLSVNISYIKDFYASGEYGSGIPIENALNDYLSSSVVIKNKCNKQEMFITDNLLIRGEK